MGSRTMAMESTELPPERERRTWWPKNDVWWCIRPAAARACQQDGAMRGKNGMCSSCRQRRKWWRARSKVSSITLALRRGGGDDGGRRPARQSFVPVRLVPLQPLRVPMPLPPTLFLHLHASNPRRRELLDFPRPFRRSRSNAPSEVSSTCPHKGLAFDGTMSLSRCGPPISCYHGQQQQHEQRRASAVHR